MSRHGWYKDPVLWPLDPLNEPQLGLLCHPHQLVQAEGSDPHWPTHK
jgi:hypothetical protein